MGMNENESKMRLLILFNCFLFFCFLSVPYLIGQRSLSNTHRTERYLWLYKDISFIFQIVLFAESTDTFRCFVLARSFYDNLFQLPSHSVWSFVEDFLLLRKRVLLDFNASWEIYSSFIFFSFVRYIHFGNFWLIVLCVSIFFIYLFLLSTALSLFAVALSSLHYWSSICCSVFSDSCLFLFFTISSVFFPLLLNIQLFLCAGVFVHMCVYLCVCVCVCSSTCKDPRGESEWHTADTQQESILSTSYLRPLPNKATRQERRGEEIICLSVRLPVNVNIRRRETEIANHYLVCFWRPLRGLYMCVCVCVPVKPVVSRRPAIIIFLRRGVWMFISRGVIWWFRRKNINAAVYSNFY